LSSANTASTQADPPEPGELGLDLHPVVHRLVAVLVGCRRAHPKCGTSKADCCRRCWTCASRPGKRPADFILLGSFLVPVTFVAFAFQRADEVVTAERVFTAFVYGGVLGVLGASLFEAALLQGQSVLSYVGVGLTEEAVKLAALWLPARRLPRYTVRDGIVLGAAVGFGFGALESAGYAFNALFTANGVSLISLVETEVLRGLLAPVGHGLWTAILGGVLFGAAARRGRLRLTGAVLGLYLVVAGLHALWDASQQIAVWLTLLLTGSRLEWLLIEQVQAPAPTPTQVHLFTVIDCALLLMDALVGVLLLRWRWRRAADVTAQSPHPEGM
jgi:RsiW-degrading membrane proteinase PrsW (M82 family)